MEIEKNRQLTNMQSFEDKTETRNPLDNNCSSKYTEFLLRSIKEKEADQECPVCLETAEGEIYSCPGAAPALPQLRAPGGGVPRVQGAVPRPAQETPIRREDGGGARQDQGGAGQGHGGGVKCIQLLYVDMIFYVLLVVNKTYV